MKYPYALHVGFGDVSNDSLNQNYFLIARLNDILKYLNINIPLIITTNKPNAEWLDYIKGYDVRIIKDNTIEKFIIGQYPFFKKINGYGKHRLLQYILSPNGCIIRDQDTTELNHHLIQYQINNLNKIVNSKKLVYLYSDYVGRGTFQYQNGPHSLELNKLDDMWYNPNNDTHYKAAFTRGKYYQERQNKNSIGLFGWGNHGSCAISTDLFLKIPPIAGNIRGGDDSFPLRILQKTNNHNYASEFLKWPVYHNFIQGKLNVAQIKNGLNTLIQSILFNPYWKILEEAWIKSDILDSKQIPSVINSINYESKLEAHIFAKQKSIENTIEQFIQQKVNSNNEDTINIIEKMNLSRIKYQNTKIFELTIDLYKNWQYLHDDYSQKLYNKFIIDD